MVPKRVVSSQRAPHLEAFKSREDSLAIPASKAAALAGFHPFADLPKILLDLVYQGSDGCDLLRHDSVLLDLRLVSEEEVLLDLSKKAGSATLTALQAALDVQRGKRKLPNVRSATALKSTIVEEAKKSKNLSKEQIAILKEGTRGLVDKAFGTHHENDALDLYERKCGCEVLERNSCYMSWGFVKDETDEMTSLLQGTVVPITAIAEREAKNRRKRRKTAENDEPAVVIIDDDSEGEESQSQIHDDSQAQHSPERKPFFTLSGIVDGVREELWYSAPEPTSDDADDDDWYLRKVIVECKHRMRRAYASPPIYEQIQACIYCMMYGVEEADIIQVLRRPRTEKKTDRSSSRSVDDTANPKISDYFPVRGQSQLASSSNASLQRSVSPTSSGEESRSPNQTVLEPKGISINSTTEVDMEEIEKEKEGTPRVDIVLDAKAAVEVTKVLPTGADGGAGMGEIATEGSNSVDTVVDAQMPVNDTEPAPSTKSRSDGIGKTRLDTKRASGVDIVVNRVSLNDPVMCHAENWRSVVLPRLRSFVEAVYKIRQNDELRYMLLYSMSDMSGSRVKEGWDLLHSLCGWLKHCDTAYSRLPHEPKQPRSDGKQSLQEEEVS